MSDKLQEDELLNRYLNRLLDDMPVMEPSGGLTNHIMKRISMTGAGNASLTVQPSSPAPNRRWRNGAIALVATVLFIQSGLIHYVLRIQDGVIQLADYIQQIAR
ncbi:hypothetical protein [Paenibacillus whitsoniae]|uniref:Uncharacterized protein n=1 Tax=Paenibacillus whitsoniae TaxID=2496558 RepID=A0A430JBL1_9BACL|nr:hypothetical protein [Paenibacillus whitsoniae]RTE08411.1 hypothetical protein EJQ19_17485 [Paenibacillus whitsoniae]